MANLQQQPKQQQVHLGVNIKLGEGLSFEKVANEVKIVGLENPIKIYQKGRERYYNIGQKEYPLNVNTETLHFKKNKEGNLELSIIEKEDRGLVKSQTLTFNQEGKISRLRKSQIAHGQEIENITEPARINEFLNRHQQLLKLSSGESVFIGETIWQKGEDKRLYYNSQKDFDNTWHCLTDEKIYVREKISFTPVIPASHKDSENNVVKFYISDNKKVFSFVGKEIAKDSNGIYKIPVYKISPQNNIVKTDLIVEVSASEVLKKIDAVIFLPPPAPVKK